MKKVYLDIETMDGTVHEQVRILAADKVRASKIARMNGVSLEDTIEALELFAYAATTRAGLVPAADLEEWRRQVADFAVSEDAPAVDPTTPAPSSVS